MVSLDLTLAFLVVMLYVRVFLLERRFNKTAWWELPGNKKGKNGTK